MTEPITMNGMPLTVYEMVRLISTLTQTGEVPVINCVVDPEAVHRILRFLNTKLSDDDRESIRETIREETQPKKPWMTT